MQDSVPDVHVGDVYALLVEWCCGQGNAAQALQLVEQMSDCGLQPAQHLSNEALTAMQQVKK